MKHFIIGTFIMAILRVASTTSYNAYPHYFNPHDGVTLYNNADGLATCIDGDIYCGENCLTLEYCSAGDSILLETCPDGSLCNAVSLTCVTGGLCSGPVDFICNSLGFFPDPFDCTEYHVCEPMNLEGSSQKLSCDPPHAYDPLSSLCNLNMQDRVCVEKPIPTCTSVGQMGAQIENPNIYYICRRTGEVLYPSLYRCPPDEEFIINKCVEVSTSTASSTLSTDSSSTVPTSSPGDTTTSMLPTTTSILSTTTSMLSTTRFPCTEEGQFPDPFDCRGYYVCTEDLISYHFRCSVGYRYDAIRLACVTPGC